MGVTPASLADGQLANAKATIYTVPAATSVTGAMIGLGNGNTGAEAVIIYVKRSGSTSRIWFGATLSAAGGAGQAGGQATVPLPDLSAGDIVEGFTTTAAKVDYVISGKTVT